MKALVFQPHQDDAVISIGGTIQKLIAAGWEVRYVYVTDGRHGSRILSPEETVKARAVEAAEERELLGVTDFIEMGIEDGKVFENSKQAAPKVRQIIEEYSPDVIFIPSIAEMHPDHRATHDLVMQASDGILVAKYLVWFFPDFFTKKNDLSNQVIRVSIDAEFSKKRDAVRKHKTQLEKKRYDDMMESVNSYLAELSNFDKVSCKYAEFLGLFNLNTKENKLVEDLNAMDVTEPFHGRIEYKIGA